MQNISEIISGPVNSYQGSDTTRSLVEEQIEERWGRSELKNYDPYHTARTFQSWLRLGFKVKKGEKALRSITFIETKDQEGNVLKKIKRQVFLFYYLQVEPFNLKKSYEKNNDNQL